MDLAWQIDIVDQMIRKDPESTIGDYVALLAEIQTIKPNEENMNNPKLYTEADAVFIIKHHRDYSAGTIAYRLGLEESVVRNFGSRHKLEFAKALYVRKESRPEAKALPVKEERPRPEYSNNGFITVTKKYAS